jgi:3-dehydroquinate synthase
MKQQTYSFSSASTTCYFDADLGLLDTITDPGTTIVVTDENVYRSHANHFQGRKTIVIKPGERYKTQDTVNEIIQQLISYKADRKFFIVGIGGGVVTDVTGYAASVYMRGLRFGFVPVSLLAMVDASIGGKNGVDVGPYKNLVGTIRQPEFLLYDSTFLQTLPRAEWVNGFAEIIKHACIKDGAMFEELEEHNIDHYIGNKRELDRLVSRNAMIKASVVMDDEFEKGERRLLNFGHTWGHAIETKLNIPHGHAVSIGMVVAAELSELSGFSETERIRRLLRRYELPVDAAVDRSEVFSVLAMDKKRDSNFMNYVLLNSIGEATVKKIPLDELEKLIIR